MLDIIRSPSDLRDLYPFIEEGVLAVRDKSSGCVPYIPADVYAAVLSGEATLAVIADADVPWGWTVFFPTQQVTGESSLYVWMMYLRSGAPRRVMEDFLVELDGIASQAGATGIEFSTQRRAWARRLAPHGYKVKGLVLGKEVEI